MITLEAFVAGIIERNQSGQAGFRVEVEGGEERLLIWTRTTYSDDRQGPHIFVVLRVWTNPQRLRGSDSMGIAIMQNDLNPDALARLAFLIAPGKSASEIEGETRSIQVPEKFTFNFCITGKVSVLANSGDEAGELSQRVLEGLEGVLRAHASVVDSCFIEVKLYEEE